MRAALVDLAGNLDFPLFQPGALTLAKAVA